MPEPLHVAPGFSTSRDECRITYRNPETGEEYSFLAPNHLREEHRRQLAEAGYQVVVQTRTVTTTAWRTVKETR
ncbi:hypothetical protein IU449_27005 [Nocardia higoensis]|uniref:Uncharacterized protein n=1 Tax=Nocardia higoensis TaxID=228599 RepID=A0ABS0DI61_9NOCA|nr:hypothetical protein [Nocardia higoensis]MBF6358150.1 hypothetical protein [Nocardia higoensis]